MRFATGLLVGAIVAFLIMASGIVAHPTPAATQANPTPLIAGNFDARQDRARVRAARCLPVARYRFRVRGLPAGWRRHSALHVTRTRQRADAKKASRCAPWYITAQIRAANHLAVNSVLDPWPNCPDPGPRDNQGPGHSWHDTVGCENGGNWLDSPGFYRCGLQFHPMWERVYGRLCP